MRKQDIPASILANLGEGALQIFLAAVNEAEQKQCSEARCFVAGYLALQRAGYSKNVPTGVWQKGETVPFVVKLQKLTKQDDERKLVFGFFSVVEINGVPVIDSQGDVITSESLENAVYKYVMFSRMGDERHDERVKAVLIESMVFTKEKQNALNIDLGYVGWWGGFKVLDDEMWNKFKTGEYESFSIGGRANYVNFDV